MNRPRIAITAAGVVSPLGRGLAALGDGLLAGRQGVKSLRGLFGDEHRALPVRYGAWVEARDFAPAPRLDRAGRLPRSLQLAGDALQQLCGDAPVPGLGEAGLHCGIGVGQQLPDLAALRQHGARPILDAIDAAAAGGERPGCAFEVALRADFGTELLRRAFELGGLSSALAGTCSASTQACIAACEDIAAGAAAAVGGGHDSLLSLGGLYFMYSLGTLSPTEHEDGRIVRPFDVHRDGTLLGEGAVYFLFEELEHARRRGARILAEVLGYSSALDGYHITNPDPSGDAAVRMIEDALAQAELRPEQIDYVNAHGTGTLLNDVVEAKILHRALRGHRPYVSSSKAQVGHLIAACGALGLASCLVALERQVAPPACNVDAPDPECDLRLAPLPAGTTRIEHVLCNSFGFGGQNACMILRRGERT